MNDDRLDEAKTLAWKFHPIDESDQIKRECFIEGFTAGRESVRAEMQADMPASEVRARLKEANAKHEMLYEDRSKAWENLQAEQKRSRKLIEAISDLSCHSDVYIITFLIDEAIAEYEASKCQEK